MLVCAKNILELCLVNTRIFNRYEDSINSDDITSFKTRSIQVSQKYFENNCVMYLYLRPRLPLNAILAQNTSNQAPRSH